MNTLRATSFVVPESLNASSPPEIRLGRRDYVKMMMLDRVTGNFINTRFDKLPDFLQEGDLLVLNNSRTIPAVFHVNVLRNGLVWKKNKEVRLARCIAKNVWQVLIPDLQLRKEDVLLFSEGLRARVNAVEEPFTVVEFSLCGTQLFNELYTMVEPVRYEYIHEPWELDYYQTVYATVPGSVEMPSAGRAFSWELLQTLRKRGIKTAYLQLHTGLSYLLDDRWHQHPSSNKERYEIPATTLAATKQTKENGGRVIAVGTTVVRALESVAALPDSKNHSGWTDLYINDNTALRTVDGLITGFHEPEASHLDMLSAFIDREQLITAYHQAIDSGYLWHEFGDINLIL
ncbi:S-adenosylmethionine:tRNA ribosyltransferase-isomerase [Evansella sp. AB-rgal1]|uniref:S-adenosylmethionine:tRNA ribosyltransferase-isomerase n=1 Tax=Evansella sp. AB-rgal1 TaxID=3242696 RepID=UPI00359DCDE1